MQAPMLLVALLMASFAAADSNCEDGYTLSKDGTTCTKDDPVTNAADSPCTCPHGTPIQSQCLATAPNKCRECDKATVDEANSYFLNTDHTACVQSAQCKCLNGSPPNDCQNSRTDNANVCETCQNGYVRASDGSSCALQKPCTCDNGVPKAGVDSCTSLQPSMCASCDCQFQLSSDNKECTYVDTTVSGTAGPNCETSVSCQCTNGSPAVNPTEQCTSGSRYLCVSCVAGYSLSSQRCEKTSVQCECRNGTPDSSGCVGQADLNLCEKCEAGFQLQDGQCVRVVDCQCKDGNPATGCVEGHLHKCEGCIAGASHRVVTSGIESYCDVSESQTFTCLCQHGIAGEGAIDKCQKCIECKEEGYELNDEKCVLQQLKCSCPNGTPPSDGCIGTSTRKCLSCNNGFELSSDGSVGSVCNQITTRPCMCDAGTPGTDCTHTGQKKCQACARGFVLSSDETSCQQYQSCTCPNGRPDTLGCTGETSRAKCE